MICPRCNGTGICVECKGTGNVKCSDCAGNGYNDTELESGKVISTPCKRCNSTGYLKCNPKCSICAGTGVFEPNKNVVKPNKNVAKSSFLDRFKDRELTATGAICILIILLSVLSFIPGLKILFYLGAFYPPLANGKLELWRYVTSLFLHGGFMHLFCNVLSLYMIAPLLERILSTKRFLLLFFISGITGNIFSSIFYPMAPSIGASGALFGVLAGYLGINIKNKIFSPAIIRELIFWIVFNIIIGLSIPNINMAAHAGGAIAGFIFTYFIRLNQYDVMKNLFRR